MGDYSRDTVTTNAQKGTNRIDEEVGRISIVNKWFLGIV